MVAICHVVNYFLKEVVIIFRSNSKTALFMIVFVVILIKMVVVLLYFNFVSIQFGQGNDVDYYHAAATGLDALKYNIWPEILYEMNELGLYSRNMVVLLNILLCWFVIPFFVCKASADLPCNKQVSVFIFPFLLISFYPAFNYYALDIYRETFMIFIFMVSILSVRSLIKSGKISIRFFFLCVCFGLCFVMYNFRPYLGLAFLISSLCYPLVRYLRDRIILSCVIYFLFLYVACLLGLLDSITHYRNSVFGYSMGGSGLNISFDNKNLFILSYIYSFFGQMIGLHFTNIYSVAIFLTEGLFCFVLPP